jgi:hypothetical protein
MLFTCLKMFQVGDLLAFHQSIIDQLLNVFDKHLLQRVILNAEMDWALCRYRLLVENAFVRLK